MVKGATTKAAYTANLNPANPYPFSRIHFKVFMKRNQLAVCQMDGIVAQ